MAIALAKLPFLEVIYLYVVCRVELHFSMNNERQAMILQPLENKDL